MKWRMVLAVATLMLAVGYAFVVFVAMVTSGAELLTQPLAYYAAIMPFVYSVFCFLTATGHIPRQHLRTYGILLHIAVVPCLVFSFLGIGILLPLVAFLWYQVYRWRISTADGSI